MMKMRGTTDAPDSGLHRRLFQSQEQPFRVHVIPLQRAASSWTSPRLRYGSIGQVKDSTFNLKTRLCILFFELFCFERFVISDESMFRSDMDWPSSRNAATSVPLSSGSGVRPNRQSAAPYLVKLPKQSASASLHLQSPSITGFNN